MIARLAVPFVTDAGGAATVYSSPTEGGLLHSVFYDWVDAATGASITVTEESTGRAILTITSAGVADVSWFPRVGPHPVANTAGGTIVAGNATAGGLGVAGEMLPIVGRVKVVIAAGGATKSGTLYFDLIR